MKEKFSESAPAHAPSKPISIKTEPQATPAPTVAQVSDMPESTSTVADSSKNQEIAEGNNYLNLICFCFVKFHIVFSPF